MKPYLRLRFLATATVAGLFGLALLTVPACNTVEGAGEDLQEASEEVREEF